MAQATVTLPQLSFEEFLNYDDGTENLYELIDGVPVEMPEPSRLHQSIARFLDFELGKAIVQADFPWEPVRNSVIKVPGKDLANGRRPDIAVVDIIEQGASEARGIRTVPHLIIEVASSNWATDAAANDIQGKILAYLHLGVPVYWVVDYAGRIPEKHCDRGKGIKTIIHTRQGYGYKREEFVGDELLPCSVLPLKLTTNQIVSLGQQG